MPDVQIEASVLFGIAWLSFAVFFVGVVAGTVLVGRAYRLALAIFVVATVGGFTFSYLAGFSIGRFTAVLPLVITAFAVTQYRDLRLQLAAQAAAIGIYVLLAWIFGLTALATMQVPAAPLPPPIGTMITSMSGCRSRISSACVPTPAIRCGSLPEWM